MRVRPTDAVVSTHEPALVDVAWLERHASSEQVAVLQVDGDSTTYYEGHIPGAIPLDWYDELLETVRRGPVSQDNFEQLMRRKGISEDTHVVLSSVSESTFASHAFWLLRYYGHERVSLLDGGRAAWSRAGLPVEDAEPVARAVTRYRSPGPDPSIRVTREQVLQNYVGAPAGTLVLDCRTPAEYAGVALSAMDLAVEQHRVGGHIPGAVNLPSALLLDEKLRFHDAPRLRELFLSRGLADDVEVVVYCRIAERSALLWFALHELLGHRPVRHYDGGWAEYGSLMEVPVDRDA